MRVFKANRLAIPPTIVMADWLQSEILVLFFQKDFKVAFKLLLCVSIGSRVAGRIDK